MTHETELLPLPQMTPGTLRHIRLHRYGRGHSPKAYIQASLHANETPAQLVALHLLARNEEDVRRFTESIQDMREGVKACTVCGNLGEEEVCGICRDARREDGRIAVVEDLRDLLAIEATGHFGGATMSWAV